MPFNCGVIKNYNQQAMIKYYDHISGDHSSVELMPYYINMERLFEYYVRTLVKKELKRKNEESNEYYRLKAFVDDKAFYDKKSLGQKPYHLSERCYPDIWIEKCINPDSDKKIYKSESVYDVKYKGISRTDRDDSHQLMSYSLLLNVDKCGFILPKSNDLDKIGPVSIDIEKKQNFNRVLSYWEYYVANNK